MILRMFLLSILLAYNGGITTFFKGEVSIHIVQLILGLLALILNFRLELFIKKFKILLPYLLPFVLFIIYCLFNISPEAPLYGKYKMELLVWCLVSIFIVSISLNNLRELHYLILFTIIQMIIGILINGLTFDSSRTGAGEPIVAGRMGGIIICYAIYYVSEKNILLRTFLFGIGFLIVYLSGTRTVFIALVLIYFIAKFFNFRKLALAINFKSLKYLASSILLFGALYVLIFIWNIFRLDTSLLHRFEHSFSYLNADILSINSSFTRIEEWISAVQVWRDNYYFGIGIGGFGYVFHGFDERMYPHNIFLELLCEMGIIGFLIFIYFMYKLLRAFKNLTVYLPVQYTKFTFSLFLYGLFTSQTSLELPNQFILFTSLAIILTYISFQNLKTTI